MKALPKSKEEIAEIIFSKDEKIQHLEEENRVLRLALFAPKTEKNKYVFDNKQLVLPFFDMPENPPVKKEEEDQGEIEIPGHTRKKRGRKTLPDDLPRVEIYHDIPEEDKICSCSRTMEIIDEETSEKLDMTPPKMHVVVHIRPKYACKKCEGVEDDGPTVKIAPPPAQIIPKSIATATLLAYILVAKFCDALPFYRQEKIFTRLGIDISRQNMCNWAMKISQACEKLMELLYDQVRGGPVINADETTVQVLNEPGRSPQQKSYMWVFRGGTSDSPAVIYQYQPSRAARIAEDFLRGYQGVVQTDGYVSYDFLDIWEDILHVGCWAHARRKFHKALKAGAGKKKSNANKALSIIRELYRLEKQAKKDGLTPDEIKDMRQNKAKPILDDMKIWLLERKRNVTPKSLTGKAITYCLNQWQRLYNYIYDGHVKMDNNIVENSIRPFVVGRKNWLFSGTPDGAAASATLYSLIETAKANNLEPYAYLRFLFEKLPFTSEDNLKSLLPTELKPEDLILPDVVTGV